MGALPFLFEFWAMEHQLPPEGDWRSWVILGGRGAGKTRAGAEWVRSMVEGSMPLDKGRAHRVALVGETIEQVREVMIFGDSGILACSPPDRRPKWHAGRKMLEWPNGAVASVHTAFDPEGLRGPQFDAAWVDEYGCAAIDKGTNEPNKFLDPKSSESTVPRYSNGARDDFMQRQYLRAMHTFWNDPAENPVSEVYAGPMVDMSRAFVWAWDTRPYPFFPNSVDVWADGENYPRGHWISGRTSTRSLASVVGEICDRAGLSAYDTSALYGSVRGYTIDDVNDARSALQPLMLRYAFDAVERDGLLRFVMRDGTGAVAIDPDRVAISSDLEGRMEQTREAEAELAGRVRLRFVETDGNFDVLSEEAVLPEDATHSVSTSEVPIALTRSEGRQVTERWLTEARVARDSIRLALPMSQISVGAGDVVQIAADQHEGTSLYRVDRVEHSSMQLLEGVRIEPEVYQTSPLSDDLPSVNEFVPPVPVTSTFLDLPLLTGDEVPHAPHIVATGTPWPGTVAVYQSGTNSDFILNTTLAEQARIGFTQSPLSRACSGVVDRADALEVRMLSGTLSSIDDEALLNGGNLMAIGNGTPNGWELLQFRDADLLAPNRYLLSHRLRGQLGTDALMPDVWPVGSWVVIINSAVTQIDLASSLRRISQTFRIGPARRPVSDPVYEEFSEAFDGNGLRPYAPVHLRATSAASGVDVSWIRRTRVDGDSWDLADVPLGEESEQYTVRVMSGSDVIREEIVTVPTWSYADAQRISDGVGSQFDVSVAQNSARYGPGPFGSVSVNLT